MNGSDGSGNFYGRPTKFYFIPKRETVLPVADPALFSMYNWKVLKGLCAKYIDDMLHAQTIKYFNAFKSIEHRLQCEYPVWDNLGSAGRDVQSTKFELDIHQKRHI